MPLFAQRLSLSFLLLICTSLFNTSYADKNVTLNFVDADIRSVIASVSKDTGKNFLVDPRVKGKFTIYSSTPVNANALYEIFVGALRTHGYMAIEQGDMVHIVPLMQAKQSPTPVSFNRIKHPTAKQITHVIQIQNISAVKLIPVLRPLMPKEGYIAAYAATNLIIISDSEKNIARLKQLIHSMDQSSSNDIDIIPLLQADANQVLKTLKNILPKKQGQKKILFSVDTRSNSLLLSGDSLERERLKSIIRQLDSPVQMHSSQHVVYLKHASAKELAPILDKIIQAEEKNKKDKNKAVNTKASIIADESTNSLIISADLDAFRSLSSVIDQLDIQRTQVMIEAIIAEVSRDASEKLGFEWGLAGQKDSITGIANSSNSGALINAISAISDGDTAKIAAAAATGGFSGLIANDSFGVLINTLKTDSDFNILSTPRILTVDNKEAEIIVGENVPFLTGSFTSSNNDSNNPFQTIKREDIGLTLRIKPQINTGGRIGLEVYQEISTVKTASSAVDLTTTKRSIKSNVLVNDGKILALGGLMDDVTTDSKSGIPLLMDIPYLGWLFSSQDTITKKRTLMVFIKPTILKNQTESDHLTREFFKAIEEEQYKFNQKSLLITPDFSRYQLPEIEPATTPVEKVTPIKLISAPAVPAIPTAPIKKEPVVKKSEISISTAPIQKTAPIKLISPPAPAITETPIKKTIAPKTEEITFSNAPIQASLETLFTIFPEPSDEEE